MRQKQQEGDSKAESNDGLEIPAETSEIPSILSGVGGRERGRQTDRQTDRDRDRQRQTQRERDRERERERETDRHRERV